MKNILLILAIAFSSASFGQGNLQFNQVINQAFNSSVAPSSYVTLATIVVPAGKVLKIESVGFYPNDGNAVEGVVLIGGHVAFSKSVFNTTGLSEVSNCPIWLSEGSYTFQVRHEWGVNINVKSSYSAIEFNVVP